MAHPNILLKASHKQANSTGAAIDGEACSWLSTSLEYISGNDLMSERVAVSSTWCRTTLLLEADKSKPSDIDVENAGDISDREPVRAHVP